MNTQQSIFQPIFAYVKTTHEADELLNHIETLLSRLYTQETKPFESIAYSILDPEIAKAIHEVFLSLHFSWSHPEEIKIFFTRLKDELKRFEVITLTLAFTPTSDAVTAFSNWTRSNISLTTLLEINIDHHLLGGAIIIYQGNYLDLSVRKKLDEYFQKHGNEILSRLK
jgi:hypothetical protein